MPVQFLITWTQQNLFGAPFVEAHMLASGGNAPAEVLGATAPSIFQLQPPGKPPGDTSDNALCRPLLRSPLAGWHRLSPVSCPEFILALA
eukprot:11151653-Karenia_brevis.AAC.1